MVTSQCFDPSLFFEDQNPKSPRVHSGPLCKGTCAPSNRATSSWEDLPGAVHHTNRHIHHVRSDTTGSTAVVTAWAWGTKASMCAQSPYCCILVQHIIWWDVYRVWETTLLYMKCNTTSQQQLGLTGNEVQHLLPKGQVPGWVVEARMIWPLYIGTWLHVESIKLDFQFAAYEVQCGAVRLWNLTWEKTG